MSEQAGWQYVGSRCIYLAAALAFVGWILVGCTNPVQSTTSASNGTGTTSASTGTITGKATYSGLSDNSGIVVSAEGTTGATTASVLSELQGNGINTERAVASQSLTDSAGNYTLTGLPAGTYTVYASSPDSLEKAVTTGVSVTAGRSVTAADLSLTPTGNISGTANLAGATSGNLGITVFVAGTSFSAMTDDSGAYTISDVPVGTGYTLVASASNGGYDSAIENVDVNAQTTTTAATLSLPVHVTPVTTGTISGTANLNGATSGNSGIFVYLAGTSLISMTNDAGAYTLSGVPAGSGYVLIASTSITGYDSAIENVNVSAQSTTSAPTLSLPVHVAPVTTGTVTGTIRLDGATSGNSGIFVYLTGTSCVSMTNDAGGYTLTNVPPGTYTLVASKEAGFVPGTIYPVSVTAGNSTAAGNVDLVHAGTVSTFVGLSGTSGTSDGTGSSARFNQPRRITSDGVNLYVADTNNHTIRKVAIATGVVTTVAGLAGVSGTANGTGSSARFDYPAGIATDGTNLYVADSGNHVIREIALSTGTVSTLAGTMGVSGYANGTGTSAQFNSPTGIATDGTNLYVTDWNNQVVRKIVIATAVVTTLAGNPQNPGSSDGTGSAAEFFYPQGIATDGTNVYVADTQNDLIRKIVIASGQVTTLAGTAGAAENSDGIGTAARFNRPVSLAVDGSELFVADNGSETIRRIDLSTSSVSTVAGRPGVSGSLDGWAGSALFGGPFGIVANGSTLYIVDSSNDTVRALE